MRRRVPAFGASATIHAIAIGVTIWLAQKPVAVAGQRGGTASPKEPVVVLVESLPGAEPESTPGPAPSDLGIHIDEGASTVDLPGFAFDFSKVVNRASVLFPFLTGSVSLDHVTAPSRRETRRRLANPLAQEPAGDRKPPLVLGDAAMQSLVDKSWSRRDRWRVFDRIATVVNAHDPDKGRVPALLGAYVAQNGLQPYIDSATRDPRLWVELGLAADHADFIDFVNGYVSRHAGTRAATELLFLVDKLAQGSLDALTTLADTDPSTDLQWTRGANREAYEAIVTIRSYYRTQLERRGLLSADALRAHYGRMRLALLESILLTTPHGYRSADARFLIGAIYWSQGKTAEARRAWKDITIDPADTYAFASAQILDAMRAAEERGVDRRRVDRILANERGRWVSFSYDRLQAFGYRFDTF
jgi:hypothetical protein